MTSEDADRIVRQLERQNAALESIAKSLERLAFPVVTMPLGNPGAAAPNPLKIGVDEKTGDLVAREG